MNMRTNMALSALVCAGLVAWLSGFVSQQAVAPEDLKQDAVKIEVAAPVAAAATDAPAVVEAAAPAVEAPAAEAAVVEAAAPAPATAAVESALALVAKADVARGKTVAKACLACHVFESNGKNGIGPNLNGVVGRKKQSVAGFKYSGSLNAQGGDTWNYVELNKFLEKPKAYAAATKMTYAGLKKVEDRAAVLAYLASLNNAPMPTAAEIAAEAK